MGRFSPTVSPGPSWTQGLQQGAESLVSQLMQRRQFQQQQNQQDITNAENGVYRGTAPRGALVVNTPDFQINDTPGGSGPQVSQVGDFSATNTGSRPLPGGISALNPMADALMQGRGQAQAAPGGTTTTFNGPDGRGLTDTQRYQQIKSPSGAQFYLDREQTPDAQALRRSVLSGEMGLNKALMIGTLRNAGLIANTDERNKGLAYRTDSTNASYAPGGARYEGAVSKMQQQYGYVDANGQYHPGSVPTGRIYTAAQELPGKTQSAIDINNARPYHPPLGGGNRMSIGGGAQPTGPEKTAINNMTKQYEQPGKVPGRLNADGSSLMTRFTPGLSPDAASAKAVHNANLTRMALGQDTLSNPGSLRATAPASTSGVEKDGTAASTTTPQPQGLAQPKHLGSGHANQSTRTVSPTLPASPTAPNTPTALKPLGAKDKQQARTDPKAEAFYNGLGYKRGVDY